MQVPFRWRGMFACSAYLLDNGLTLIFTFFGMSRVTGGVLRKQSTKKCDQLRYGRIVTRWCFADANSVTRDITCHRSHVAPTKTQHVTGCVTSHVADCMCGLWSHTLCIMLWHVMSHVTHYTHTHTFLVYSDPNLVVIPEGTADLM
jgi:hypothetical protein